ncbi:MAG: class I SAM-dependent methyltransferase, partial [bacterium]
DLAGKRVCVLGSGDNLAAFALAGMGAQVTSVDISQRQLDIAAGRAGQLGLDITFLRADVTDLAALDSASFDLVYTGGHVAVWVADIWQFFAEATRIITPGGLLVISEYHPFRRVWQACANQFILEDPYFRRGPFTYDRADAGSATPLPSYEFHWTVSDYTTALLDAGCELLALREFGDGREKWERNNLEGLPLSLLLVGRKKSESE